jgi:type II secretory pathway component GspD/PulD (secretin)
VPFFAMLDYGPDARSTAPPPESLELSPTAPLPQAAAPPPPPKHFDVDVNGEETQVFLKRLALKAGVKLKVYSDLFLPAFAHLRHATFEEVLAELCDEWNIKHERLPNGSYRIGYAAELTLATTGPDDPTDVEVIHRSRHLDANNLAQVLSTAFPALKIMASPIALTPSLEGGGASSTGAPGASLSMGGMAMGGMSMGSGNLGMGGMVDGGASGMGIRSLSSSDGSFKRHQIALKGPAGQVRRALTMARRMDKPRRQVKINVRLSEMSSKASSDLGIAWDLKGPGLAPVTFTELPSLTSGTFSGNPGLKLGAFAHSAAMVNLQLNALQQKGEVKTLANPSLTVIDGERCFILMGDKSLYPKQTGTTANGNPIYDVAEMKTGIYLQMAVQVGIENDVTITAYPQVSVVSGYQTINGGEYPIVSTREAQTTVRLRNQEVLVIGGLHQDTDTRQVTGLPLLSHIPILGKLFGSKNSAKTREELVLIIEPEILAQGSEGPTTLEETP